jgi:hypothetical protein
VVAETVDEPGVTERISSNSPEGAAVLGAIANTSPGLRDPACALVDENVIEDRFEATTRLASPTESRTFVVFGMIVE